MVKKNGNTEAYARDLLYALKHPITSVKIIPDILRHWNLYSMTRRIEGYLDWTTGIALYKTVLNTDHPSLNVVEVGSFHGKSTIFLSAASQKTGRKVLTFEWFQGLKELDPEMDSMFNPKILLSDREMFERNLKNCRLRQIVDLTVGDARNTLLPKIKDGGFSVAFLDVDLYSVTSDLLNQLQSVATGKEIIIVHDYDSIGIKRAIDEFCSSYRSRIKRLSVFGEAPLNSAMLELL
ncbi:MAG: class I SAM-dependent methyltransferase [Dehalococcoidales bacterium]|nr:class I SAM-dependent methyltransferase [Dehalococcoidales bacterium]